MIAIHIGASKAGSTTIQQFLRANAETLRQIGVDYPRICQSNRGYHVNLYYNLRGHPNFKPQFGSLKQLVDHIGTQKFKTTILSAEELQRCKTSEVTALKESLHAVDDDIQIRLIIRDLVDLMPSTYSQSTKGGENALDFDTFFAERVSHRGTGFVETARVWGDAFGWDRLRVRVLDRKLLLNGDLIDDFLTGVGVDPRAREFERSEAISVANASPGWRVLEAVRALYSGGHGLPTGHPMTQFDADDQDERKLVGRLARQLGSELGWDAERGRYLSRAQAQQCLDIHRDAIASLNEMLSEGLSQPLGLSERGFVEREFMPEASQIAPVELRAFYDKLAARTSRKHRAAASA
jgi:hypothetical protein